MNEKSGITLLELLVVVMFLAVIAWLAASTFLVDQTKPIREKMVKGEALTDEECGKLGPNYAPSARETKLALKSVAGAVQAKTWLTIWTALPPEDPQPQRLEIIVRGAGDYQVDEETRTLTVKLGYVGPDFLPGFWLTDSIIHYSHLDISPPPEAASPPDAAK
ncbi:MAG: type II secretion system protein [Patescibacteria group bacterium]